MDFMKVINGKGIFNVRDVDTACKEFCDSIHERFQMEKDRNDKLIAENMRLKDEHYENEEIQKLVDKISELRSELGYSFRVTKEEWEAINKWKETHLVEKHGLKTKEDRLASSGAIGGRFEYNFIPTSIGTVGVVKCGSCGEEFTFKELI